MIRIAKIEDAEQLEELNNDFNGHGETTLENIKNSIKNNKQEVIVVAEENRILIAFLCIQLKKSFCYNDYAPEITELYVKSEYRRKGISQEMMTFAVEYCKKHFSCHTIELLTGEDNYKAQRAYEKFGFTKDREVHLLKTI